MSTTTVDSQALMLARVILRMPGVGILTKNPRTLGTCVPCASRTVRERGVAVVISWYPVIDPNAERSFIHTDVCAEHLAELVDRELQADATVWVEIPAISTPAIDTPAADTPAAVPAVTA